MRVLHAVISANALLMLASCTTTSADGVKTFNRKITAISSERTKLGYATHLKPDCSADTRPTIRLTSPPAHGKVEIVPEEVVAHPKNARKCDGVKTPGTVVYYTSAANYIGTDKLSFRESWANGDVRDGYVDVTVVK